jgi:hypothetical protein
MVRLTFFSFFFENIGERKGLRTIIFKSIPWLYTTDHPSINWSNWATAFYFLSKGEKNVTIKVCCPNCFSNGKISRGKVPKNPGLIVFHTSERPNYWHQYQNCSRIPQYSRLQSRFRGWGASKYRTPHVGFVSRPEVGSASRHGAKTIEQIEKLKWPASVFM